ncbi:hypothetical protein KUTeg_001115 [Tegillarca granosa]|uniref:C17orf113 probable zinc finger domain-containing protein n=1 Tax=Tegillarca granosa TaxID=220873 RepID=A0ABQ9FWU9_TEGGR|nr:hypothetical protein KUTeg_001115 [Tegillarca granosa]
MRRLQKDYLVNQTLTYDSEKHLMFCNICIRAQVVNVFTTGCSMMKREAVTKHENRKGDQSHKRAIEIIDCSNSMIESRKRAMQKSKYAVIGALRNVYFAAINNLANVTVPDLNDLCIQQHTAYSHNQSVQEFQLSIAQALQDELLSMVRESGIYSVMTDESSNISVHQNMVVYIRYLVEELGRLSLANADCIVAELLKALGSKGLQVKDMVGISTDWASVMVGCKAGVVTQLKLALSCGGAEDRVPYLVQFQVLNSIYKYFHNSPKNQAKLEAIQAVLNSHATKFKEVFYTRWLNFEGPVHAIVINYPAILSLRLHKPVSTYKFLYCAHFLSDMLKQLCILCKMHQKTDITFTEVSPVMRSAVATLENFIKTVPSEPSIDDSGLCTFEFAGNTIKDSANQRQEDVSACEQFVTGVVENLRDRFCDKGDELVMTVVSVSIEKADLDNEDLGFMIKDVTQVALKQICSYPSLGLLAKRLLVLSVSTVHCERNLIKTDLRNSIKPASLDNLMRIFIEGPLCSEFNYDKAYDVWASMKPRRILQ